MNVTSGKARIMLSMATIHIVGNDIMAHDLIDVHRPFCYEAIYFSSSGDKVVRFFQINTIQYTFGHV